MSSKWKKKLSQKQNRTYGWDAWGATRHTSRQPVYPQRLFQFSYFFKGTVSKVNRLLASIFRSGWSV
jgi:hypothetical protein